jgi:hypothetical protein
LCQSNFDPFSLLLRHVADLEWQTEIFVENDKNSHDHPKADPDQEVSEYDPTDRDDERNELVRTLAEHLSEDRRLGKLEADDQENRC